MDVVTQIISYILNVITATLLQVLILLGPLIVLGVIMNLIAKQNQKLGIQTFGVKPYIYIFASLGTIIHELGHALFAIIFRHKITSISLFSPDFNSGTLGYVNHSYNPNSIYQNIGNFFIGIGPILLGSACIYLVTYLLFGHNVIDFSVKYNYDSFLNIDGLKFTLLLIYNNIYEYIYYILFSEFTNWWKILILTYVLYSIGSSLSLSLADINNALYGLFYFLTILFIFNMATIWLGDFTMKSFIIAGNFMSPLYLLIILSICINFIFMILLKVIKLVLGK